MRRSPAILALIFSFFVPVSGEARQLRTLSMRELAIHAETIVLAEPVEQPFAPRRLKVVEVLRGRGIQPGDALTLDDLGPHNLQVYEDKLAPNTKLSQRHVEQALLFLGPNRGSREQPRFEPIASGLRFWTEDRVLLVPQQLRNPGNYFMTVSHTDDWPELLRQARSDGAAMQDLFARKSLRPVGRRNQALLEWVERHRHEFGAPTSTAHPDKAVQGWGELETQIFQWVLDSCEPVDCWSAVKLYAQLNHGSIPPLHEPVFGTREGRALLLRIATADDLLEGDRIRALTLLGHNFTLWAGPLQRLPKVQFLDAKEQANLLDRLTPLLAAKSAPLRAAAARTIRRASHPEVVSEEHRESQRALPALKEAYRQEYPGEARDELAETICVIGGAKHWQELSGNPPGMVVCLRDLGRRADQASFWLNLRPCGQVVYESPTLILERINVLLVAVEKKEMPLPVVHLPKPWSEGWDGGSFLLVQFPVKDLKPGTWRVRVRGTAGKDQDKRKWTAEPKTLVLEPPPKPKGETASISSRAW